MCLSLLFLAVKRCWTHFQERAKQLAGRCRWYDDFCWVLQSGRGGPGFICSIKKNVQGEKQLWSSDSTYLSQNEIQTESHAVIYFAWQKNTESWGEEEEWRKDRKGWNRGREPRQRKGTERCFSRALSRKVKLEKTSPSDPENKLPPDKTACLQHAWCMKKCSLPLEILCSF